MGATERTARRRGDGARARRGVLRVRVRGEPDRRRVAVPSGEPGGGLRRALPRDPRRGRLELALGGSGVRVARARHRVRRRLRLRAVVLPVDVVVPTVLAGRSRAPVPQAGAAAPDPRGHVRRAREHRHRVRPRLDRDRPALPQRRLGARGVDAQLPQVVRAGRCVIAAGANLVAVLLPRADVIATPLEPQRADRPARSRARRLLFRWRDPRRRLRRGNAQLARGAGRARRGRPHQRGVGRRVRGRCVRVPRGRTAATPPRATSPGISRGRIPRRPRAAAWRACRTTVSCRTIPAASCGRCSSPSAVCSSTSSSSRRRRSRWRGRSDGSSRASSSIPA